MKIFAERPDGGAFVLRKIDQTAGPGVSVVKGGDEMEHPSARPADAIERIIHVYGTPLYRLCLVMLGNESDAEDAVQETFIKAIRAWDSFRGEASARTWLTRIAMRTCMDMRRGFWFRRVERRVTPDMLPDRAQEADAEDSALTLAVMNLPKKEREVILLHYYQDMKVNDIADTLGVTQPTVSYRLRRAKEKLRTELEGGKNHD